MYNNGLKYELEYGSYGSYTVDREGCLVRIERYDAAQTSIARESAEIANRGRAVKNGWEEIRLEVNS